MSIEKGSKWVKDGEVVEVDERRLYDSITELVYCIWFKDAQQNEHILTERDFLEQYKPYEAVYEYIFAYGGGNNTVRLTDYETEECFRNRTIGSDYQRLDFTKRERK